MAKSKYKVLYGEGNEDTLKSQSAELQNAGYEIQPAIGRQGVQDALRAQKFDLVVLGPTLSRNDRHHLPYMIKKAQPGTPVLVMHTDGERHPYVDGNVDTGVDMQHWLDKIAQVLPAPAAAKATAAGK
jgi:DNA-binding NtrC family response regulator